uniref:Uncharacterized protein n=1 Tax=Caenorhabditis japonica TaxID=281687 RepID=A0A8R1IS67_CAEJA
MTTLSVKILFFGEAQQLIGLREDTIETPINTDYEEIKRKVLEVNNMRTIFTKIENYREKTCSHPYEIEE